MLGLDVTDEKTYSTPMHQVNRCCLYWDPVPKAKKTKIAPLVTKERVKGEDLLFKSLNALYAQRTLEKDDHVQCLGQVCSPPPVTSRLSCIDTSRATHVCIYMHIIVRPMHQHVNLDGCTYTYMCT